MSPPLCSFCISLPCFQLSSALCVPWTPVRLPGCLCERWGQAGTEALCAVRLYLRLSGPGAWSLEPGAVCRYILDMSQNTAAGPMDQPTGPNEWLTVSQCRACLFASLIPFFSTNVKSARPSTITANNAADRLSAGQRKESAEALTVKVHWKIQ